MNCPYCNKSCEPHKIYPNNFNCNNCEDLHNLKGVIFIYRSKKFIYKHIYTESFHVRMNKESNITQIINNIKDPYKTILTLPGFPFNPSNIKEKLKTYLLFY